MSPDPSWPSACKIGGGALGTLALLDNFRSSSLFPPPRHRRLSLLLCAVLLCVELFVPSLVAVQVGYVKVLCSFESSNKKKKKEQKRISVFEEAELQQIQVPEKSRPLLKPAIESRCV